MPGMRRSTSWMTGPYGVIWRPCCTVASCKVRRNFRTESSVQSRPAVCSVAKALHIPVFVPHWSNVRTSFAGSSSCSDARERLMPSFDVDDAIAEDNATSGGIRCSAFGRNNRGSTKSIVRFTHYKATCLRKMAAAAIMAHSARR